MRACLGCWRTMSEYSLHARRHDQCTEMKSEKNRIHIGPVAPRRDRLVERQELLHCHEDGARRRRRRREDCGVGGEEELLVVKKGRQRRVLGSHWPSDSASILNLGGPIEFPGLSNPAHPPNRVQPSPPTYLHPDPSDARMQLAGCPLRRHGSSPDCSNR